MSHLLERFLDQIGQFTDIPSVSADYKRSPAQRFFDMWADLGMFSRFGICVVVAVVILWIVLSIL